ncbi:MAG TPA: hypothetical protein VE075_05570 [Thermoanaerobaculia bacterium]|nr:hypothetical protein [Thermoanaerobaculia bacterium]
MRPALSAALLLAVLGTALPAAEAEWLVLVGGKKIQTEGPWTLKGDLLTVHETTGRILTVGTSTVDAAACLKLNGGALRIESITTAPPPGAPVTKPDLAPAASTGGTAKPAPPKAHVPNGPSAPNGPNGPNKGAAPAAAPPPAGGDRVAAAKQAKQARLQRELRYKQIVDGCARMFVVDRVGFQHCVDSQTKAPPR